MYAKGPPLPLPGVEKWAFLPHLSFIEHDLSSWRFCFYLVNGSLVFKCHQRSRQRESLIIHHYVMIWLGNLGSWRVPPTHLATPPHTGGFDFLSWPNGFPDIEGILGLESPE